MENKEITVAGRVLWKFKSEDNSVITFTIFQQGNPTDGRSIIQIALPGTKEDVFKAVKINDVIEAKGILLAVDESNPKNIIRKIKAENLVQQKTINKTFVKIPEFGANELSDKYKNSFTDLKNNESNTIKISGQIIDKGQFRNSPNIYIVLYKEGFNREVILNIPSSEKGKVNDLKIGEFVEAYGILNGIVPQENKNITSIQIRAQGLL